MPAFKVQAVNVSGARFVEPELAKALAAVEQGASVWDDPSSWEERVLAHPLVTDVRVRRSGVTELMIELTEVRPVALVPTPILAPVDASGRMVAIDPAAHALDLPILTGARLIDGRVDDEESRRALTALDELYDLHAAFVSEVSELRAMRGDGVELQLVAGSHAERIILPLDSPVGAFLRVESAVGECEERGHVVSADARFRGQVVVRMRAKT
jgi:cell division septal protein FtsQ